MLSKMLLGCWCLHCTFHSGYGTISCDPRLLIFCIQQYFKKLLFSVSMGCILQYCRAFQMSKRQLPAICLGIQSFKKLCLTMGMGIPGCPEGPCVHTALKQRPHSAWKTLSQWSGVAEIWCLDGALMVTAFVKCPVSRIWMDFNPRRWSSEGFSHLWFLQFFLHIQPTLQFYYDSF